MNERAMPPVSASAVENKALALARCPNHTTPLQGFTPALPNFISAPTRRFDAGVLSSGVLSVDAKARAASAKERLLAAPLPVAFVGFGIGPGLGWVMRYEEGDGIMKGTAFAGCILGSSGGGLFTATTEVMSPASLLREVS